MKIASRVLLGASDKRNGEFRQPAAGEQGALVRIVRVGQDERSGGGDPAHDAAAARRVQRDDPVRECIGRTDADTLHRRPDKVFRRHKGPAAQFQPDGLQPCERFGRRQAGKCRERAPVEPAGKLRAAHAVPRPRKKFVRIPQARGVRLPDGGALDARKALRRDGHQLRKIVPFQDGIRLAVGRRRSNDAVCAAALQNDALSARPRQGGIGRSVTFRSCARSPYAFIRLRRADGLGKGGGDRRRPAGKDEHGQHDAEGAFHSQ